MSIYFSDQQSVVSNQHVFKWQVSLISISVLQTRKGSSLPSGLHLSGHDSESFKYILIHSLSPLRLEMQIAFGRVRRKISPSTRMDLLLWKSNYCIGEKGAGSRSLLSCVIGLTEPFGGQTPFSRVSARIRARSSKLLYAHI